MADAPVAADEDRPAAVRRGDHGPRVRPGQDEDAWTELNRRAFAGHPEQGTWTRADLDLREREPWFDPDGFFLAERGGKLAGFHWTKIHGQDDDAGQPGTPGDGHHHEPIGEVYVVGVDPGERGSGLGRALTLAGLRYLRSRGLFQVMLYVDETNTAAIGMYESIGFNHWGTDVMYAAPSQGSSIPDAGLARAPRLFVVGEPAVGGGDRTQHVAVQADLIESYGVMDAIVKVF